MPVSPQMRIALGRLYEEDTWYILEDLGFTDIEWVNEEGESYLPYDYTATKDGEEYFVEVRSYFPSQPVPFRQGKIKALAPLGNVLLVLWHVRDEVVDITPLESALKRGLIKIWKRPKKKTVAPEPPSKVCFNPLTETPIQKLRLSLGMRATPPSMSKALRNPLWMKIRLGMTLIDRNV